jgi:Na+-transporting methylmalonyl-CoA/oxaloacetate decarboxylase gamma subunit
MSDLAFGLQITAWGMGLVFALLGLLWALLAIAGQFEIRAAARAAQQAPPAPAQAPPPAAEPARLIVAEGAALRVSGPGAGELSPEATAAIAAAVIAHVANRRGQAAPEMRSYWPGSLLFASRWVVAGRTRQTRGYRRERS